MLGENKKKKDYRPEYVKNSHKSVRKSHSNNNEGMILAHALVAPQRRDWGNENSALHSVSFWHSPRETK